MHQYMSPELVEQWWNAKPARTALQIQSAIGDDELLQERLGPDTGRWLVAIALMASDFPGSMAELADEAEETSRSGEFPPAPSWTAIGRPVDLLLSWAPEPAVDRIVRWLGPEGRRLLAEQTTYCSENARALIRHGDLAIRRELAKDREQMDQGGPYPPAPDERIISALLELDDAETNLWLLRDERLRADNQFDVLVGRPFAPGRTEPAPRLPETLELAERIAELVDPRELARRFDAADPDHVLLALCAEATPGEFLLTPYLQLVSGLLLARAGRTDLLTEALVTAPLDPDVRGWYTLAMTGQESPSEALQRAVLLTQQEDGFFEAARVSLFYRHLASSGQAKLHRPDRLLAHGRALTEDPWYPLDWDAARRMATDPANWNQRGLPGWSLRKLLEHADCPLDLVRLMAGEETADEYVFLHLFRNRAEGLDLLRSMPLTKNTAPLALWAATPDGDWHPEVTVLDVLRLGRPARALVQCRTESFPRRFPEYVRAAVGAALDELLSDDAAQRAAQHAAMYERLPAFEGTLPELFSSP
ncbi:hypothetical protein [Streptomyces sp. H27-D2]|uniref:hypothetical protein n=1 Tax=Streptomyces sp. H27-D2 TaxID=3046304 RepID=UPI002DB5C123|nr:hypothetical protein [Streptomyces sp. H27-D2]MEC4014970.1 hypothetical protein [Streptomyces sp. H27-D2]